MKIIYNTVFILILYVMSSFLCSTVYAEGKRYDYSREECVDIALENNRLNKISKFDVAIAEAVLVQAKSPNWPTLSAGFRALVYDDPLTFDYPANTFQTPSITLPGPITIPGQPINIPAQKIEVTGDELMQGSLNLQYPLYTGGLRKALKEQAKAGLAAAHAGARRTETEVIRDVSRAYYGAVLARKMIAIADLTLRRMQATLDLTKESYETGSGTVKRTDYLRNLSMVEVIRTTKAALETQKKLVDTALSNFMGLSRGTIVEPLDRKLPECDIGESADELVCMAEGSNPQLAQLRAAILASKAYVMEARSGYKPKVGLIAGYVHSYSDIDSGLMTDENEDFFSIGIAGELPLFQGFRTKGGIQEATLKLEQLKEQDQALREGLALQIDHAFAEWSGAKIRRASAKAGLDAASENRDLNVRAYRADMVETKDVIEAQLMEAMLDAGYQKILHECLESRARLSFLVGKDIMVSGGDM